MKSAMCQAETLTLVAELQRSKRRWKILALGLLAVLVVLLFLAIVLAFFVGSRMKAEPMMALEARERAEQIWQEARRAEQTASGVAESRGQKRTSEARPTDLGNLPDISVFENHPSDRFLVDLDDFTSGHPFKGVNSGTPCRSPHQL